MFDNNDNMNNDEFFKETIIDSDKDSVNENGIEQNMENASTTEQKNAGAQQTENTAEEIPSFRSLIFSRDIDMENPYMKESLLGKLKKKRQSIWRYTAAVVCGMFAGAIIFGGALAFTANTKSGQSVIQQYSRGSSSNNGATTTASTSDSLNAPGGQELSVTQIAAKVGPSIVGILNKQSVNTWFGVTEQEGSGSGIIVSQDGYIITNSHVIEGANSLKVVLSTGDEFDATIVGQDTKTDLAVLKINASGLPAAELGKSSELQVGELAVAIGNPLGLEFQGSVTAGVISALNRTMNVDGRQYTLVQTDAAINPGNSGGALINKYGQVIGINTVKISSEDTEGMGFAIPIDVAAPIIDELVEKGYVSGRPQIGIGTRDITENMSRYYNMPVGVYIVSVSENSGAQAAGLTVGDIIVTADGKTVTTTDELNDIKDSHKAGEQIKLGIVRGGQTITVNVILGEEKPTNSQ